MKLYSADRVKRVERYPSFRDALAGTAGRKAGAKKAVQTKTDATMQGLDDLKIIVEVLDQEQVIRRAIDDHRIFTERDVPEDIDRVVVNFIRHQLTEYENKLEGIRGKVGTDQAYLAISEKVFDAIMEAYPWLEEECLRQLDRRLSES